MARAPRISRTTKWLLTVGILAILLITAYVMYDRQQAEQDQLKANIAQAQLQLTAYEAPDPAEKAELEARLKKANSRLSSVTQLQSEFRGYTESIEINEALFEAAEDANVTITGITCSMPAEEELGGFTFRVLSLSITAEGEVPPQLINFSIKVSEIFSTASIESAAMNYPGVAEDGTVTGKATINLNLKIYSYE
jgi:multidrug efflux pump subunit AcrA (membrane-fusion protein)